MKNNFVKRIAVLAAVAVMGMSMAACGNKAEEAAANETEATEAPAAEDAAAEAPAEAEEAPAEEAPAAETLTEEEYVAKAEEASDKLVTTMTNVQTDLASMDLTDIDAITEYVEGLKTPLVEFAALQAPEKYAEVQDKFKESCEALIEYFDLCIELMAPDADADVAELTAKTTEIMTTVQTNLTEAYTMMAELTGTDAGADTEEAPAEEETAE